MSENRELTDAERLTIESEVEHIVFSETDRILDEVALKTMIEVVARQDVHLRGISSDNPEYEMEIERFKEFIINRWRGIVINKDRTYGEFEVTGPFGTVDPSKVGIDVNKVASRAVRKVESCFRNMMDMAPSADELAVEFATQQKEKDP